jgi:DNA (cytosine-5)-methyltransferase 1
VPPTHGEGKMPWQTLRDVLKQMPGEHDSAKFSPAREEVYRLIPQGKNWRYIRDNPSLFPRGFLRAVMGGALDSTGGRVGFWRRLSWSEPCPTLLTSPAQKATGLCHPSKARPLSIQEYMRVQDFPDSFEVRGPLSSRYRQLGNAVPIGLGAAVGQALIRTAAGHPWKPVFKKVTTPLPPRRAPIPDARRKTEFRKRAVAATRSSR